MSLFKSTWLSISVMTVTVLGDRRHQDCASWPHGLDLPATLRLRTSDCDPNHRPFTTSLPALTRSGRKCSFEETHFIMAYVITDACIKDSLCVEVCPTDCIHPNTDEPGFETATQIYVDPEGSIDCGACVPACLHLRRHPRTRRCAGRQEGFHREKCCILQAVT